MLHRFNNDLNNRGHLALVPVDQGSAVLRAGLAQDSVNVVLHRVLGEVQPAGNFFVSLPPANQLDQLLFAAAEFGAGARLQILAIQEMLRGVADEGREKASRVHRFSGSDCPDGVEHLGSGSLAEDVTGSSFTYCKEKVLLFLLHYHHDGGSLGQILANKTQDRMRRWGATERIKQDHLWLACNQLI